MAEFSTTFSPPVATMKTELWYKATAGTLTQVFGVQGIPAVITPGEDITYRTLESSTEFAGTGVRPFESIEVTCIAYPEQLTKLKTLGDTGVEIDWYQKLPDPFHEAGETKPITIHWKGGLNASLAAIEQDDMVKMVLKIGKTSVPEIIDGLPTI